jgi:hypothetical protein
MDIEALRDFSFVCLLISAFLKTARFHAAIGGSVNGERVCDGKVGQGRQEREYWQRGTTIGRGILTRGVVTARS